MDTVATDEIRDLIAKGWVPPASALQPLSYLIEPFNKARGYKTLEQLDDVDCKNMVGIIALFDAFGIEIPKDPAVSPLIEEAPWVTVLRAYVAENDNFTMEEAVKAVGFDWSRDNAQHVGDQLQHMGLFSVRMESDATVRWTKRRALA